MAKYAQFITHKGKRILFVNAAGLPETECLVAFEEMKQALLKEGKAFLVVVDLTGLANTSAIVKKAKEVMAATKAAGIKDKPSAVVGLSRLQKTVVQMFATRTTHVFDSVDQAKEWLVQEDDKRR